MSVAILAAIGGLVLGVAAGTAVGYVTGRTHGYLERLEHEESEAASMLRPNSRFRGFPSYRHKG